jgi:hypothetical protein
MTQTEWVLSRLKRKKKLTAMDALNGCGCFRLAARINDLRRQGHNITTESVSQNGKVYARYRLATKKGK